MNGKHTKNKNILALFLSLLGVRYTNKHTNIFYNEYPHKYSLFGLSRMLTHYGVDNMGIKVTNKEDVYQLDTPFIAHLNNDFVVVEQISPNSISYYWDGDLVNVSTKSFLNIWSGVALLAEINETSIEPEYEQHKKKEILIEVRRKLLILAIIAFIGISVYQSNINQNFGFILLFVFNLVGIYIGYLLVQRQMHIHNNITDKICSLFARTSCNDILDSPAATFMNIIRWSELGLSYFISNIIIIIYIPYFLPYLVLFNLFTLPYSLWSVWYQKFRARVWCLLCLIVQMLFWGLFIINFIYGFIQIPTFSIVNFLSIVLIYATPFLVINFFLSNKNSEQAFFTVTQQYNSLKANEKVFLTLLKECPYYTIDSTIPVIAFGNSKAKNVLTIFTNPHCEPCARMHKAIKLLLKETDNQFAIQYLLSSFNNELDSSCEFFLLCK